MTNYLRGFSVAATAVALLGGASVALAAPGGVPGPGHPPVASTTISRGHDGMEHATGTPEMHGSTTPMWANGRAFPGIVVSVSGSSLIMSGRDKGENASTTYTVMVASTTKIMKGGMPGPKPMMGSTTQMASGTPMIATTTGMLSDIIVGSKVEVMGKLATSTKTITADRIVISGNGKGEGEKGKPAMPPGKGKGLLEKLKSFFGFHPGPVASSSASTSSAAATEGAHGLGAFLKSLLGIK